MAIYNDIIKTLGENLAEYNVGAWALFRDQMATDISNQYIFGGGKKSDETLLGHSLPYIKESQYKTKEGNTVESGHPFTYYTKNGPVNEIDANKPILANPESQLKITSDFKANVNEPTSLYVNGNHYSGEYDEKRVLRGKEINGGLDKVTYVGGHSSDKDLKTTLLDRTIGWFEGIKGDYISNRFATQISRFHSDLKQTPSEELSQDIGLQAFSNKYGLSHGRNLLKAQGNGEDAVQYSTNENGYDDPYCRVWTWHKQYHSLKDTMRPFGANLSYSPDDTSDVDRETLDETYNWSSFRSIGEGGFPGGGYRLQKHGVMYDNGGHTNGLVNITPSTDPASNGNYDDARNVSVEHCMFSIENLAWKGTFTEYDDLDKAYGLSREQKGPLGGRIMWFPPYDLKFNESTAANWQSNEFIGRGEPIFTYANTVRSGTLSFKLLIDHPAILDYWERRSVTGNINESGVDDVESKEQEMLRFFAGCSMLTAKKEEPSITTIDKNTPEDNGDSEGPVTSEEKTLKFMVFYPNNYSGKDDSIGGAVDPIEYLMNGVGANKQHIGSGTDYSKNQSDYPTNITMKYHILGSSDIVGGYEMRSNCGVSVITTYTNNNKIVDIEANGNVATLVKMIGSEANKSESGTTDEWAQKRYYYRVDKDTLNQILNKVSYIDKKSYCLNSVGYYRGINEFQLNESETSIYSFTEVFIALNDDYGHVFDGLYNPDRVAELKSIFANEKGKIKRVSCKGIASSQGNNASSRINYDRNKKLARNRAITINKWLRKKFSNDVIFEDDTWEIQTERDYNREDSNELMAKLYRSAIVEITYGGEETSNTEDTKVVIDESGNTENNSSVIYNEDNAAAIPENEESSTETSITLQTGNVRYDGEALFFKKLTENEPIVTKLLSERINNFDPVFHSMSPEGFNSRLTFLNQCMRQGPTISGSDTFGGNANNLAFGRPPVCVLRVGDFYNTKIIITSMTIDYDPLVWDLNQEGIGVMPMIANISLNFNFIGGSDLGGPIQRLQNATSFNYYANAGVYDNRSENIEYSGPDSTTFKAYDPYFNKR